MRQGRLFVISGPSGTGKGTVGKRILEDLEDIEYSISMTTRAPREGEEHGKHYYFVDEEEFLRLRDEDGFLESAVVFENYYGTPREKVREKLASGLDVVLEIDIQGAAQVRTSWPSGVFIFLLPPSLKELRRRLTGRGTDAPEVIELRLRKALGEIEQVGNYDYYVVNDDLERAVAEVEAIIVAEHRRVPADPDEIVAKYKEEI